MLRRLADRGRNGSPRGQIDDPIESYGEFVRERTQPTAQLVEATLALALDLPAYAGGPV
jgi:hypothetical protein